MDFNRKDDTSNWRGCIIFWRPSLPSQKFIFLFVNVSVTVDFVTALNPQPGGPEILLSKYLSSDKLLTKTYESYLLGLLTLPQL
jgi:hypothetical protein